ncbi:MAG: hypothetical protein CR982_08560 [Candidatus Cloacimonadota bacterium]|nr:MAG: hypothetical protein CR982_08560 [Candidatus Cloacimonadota bacterium]PIE78684.1 MAG: hypothetical protein CSA15_06485 [Candidatus Delongbacteria bacterium]
MQNKNNNKDFLNLENSVFTTHDISEEERILYAIEVEFKGSRKEVHKNPKKLSLRVSDYVLVTTNGGEDMGKVKNIYRSSILAEDFQYDGEVIRRSNAIDLRRLHENRKIEDQILIDSRKKAKKYGLDMKFLDIEYKFDRRKLVFFFTADGRVDFRELVKNLASEYRTRIELRQIGVRDEARRVGGIGMCGRETCCSSFLKSFSPINVSMARDQNLFIKAEKFSGLCGKLMCCLKYEHSFYLEHRKGLPEPGTIIKTEKGDYLVTIYDIFNNTITIQSRSGDYITYKRDDFIEYISKLPQNSLVKQGVKENDNSLDDNILEQNDNGYKKVRDNQNREKKDSKRSN